MTIKNKEMKHMMKYSLVFAALLISTFCYAQTLHTIVFCNTIDESIGESMSIELKNVTSRIKTLNAAIDYDMDFHSLDGHNCTKDNLKLVIDQMDVDQDDVILTFYGGHGSHAENNESDPWPQYCMNTGFENQNNWVPMASLAKWIQAKKPRLAIILSNCCNVVQKATTIKPLWAMGGDYSSLNEKNAINYRKLFSAKGLVMATSSKVSEPSWCGIPQGGLFTCDLLQALEMVGNGSVSPDWNSVLQKTYDLCSMRDIVDREGIHHKQHPYFKVVPDGYSVKDDDDARDRYRDRKDTDPLGQALLSIVNKNISQSDRMSMIPDIMNKYLGNFSKIMTVGTDMETVIDYEEPMDFLRRICLSPYIKQVNIISKNGGVLTVHEVRGK